MGRMVVCPACEGHGKHTAICVMVVFGQKPVNPPLVFACVVCKGLGIMSVERRSVIEAKFAKAEKPIDKAIGFCYTEFRNGD